MSGYRRPMVDRGFSHGAYGRDIYSPDRDRAPMRDRYSKRGGESDLFPRMDPLSLQAQVIVIDPERRCRAYAEMFLSKVKKLGLICDIVIIDKFTSPSQVIDEATARGLLYTASINLQNEMHKSITVNILQGQPQEHRNMPYEDALKLISRSFDAHLLELGGTKTNEDEIQMMPGMQDDKNQAEDIDPALSLLLINLAEGKNLKLPDLDKVIAFLNEKRAKLTRKLPSSQTGHEAPKPVQPPSHIASAHAENLQAKINKLFGDSTKQQSTVAYKLSRSPVDSDTRTVSDDSKKSVGIDFDNPTVQNALQNLMKTGPTILNTIRSTAGTSNATVLQTEAHPIPTIGSERSQRTNDDDYRDETSPKPSKRARPGRHAIAGFY